MSRRAWVLILIGVLLLLVAAIQMHGGGFLRDLAPMIHGERR